MKRYLSMVSLLISLILLALSPLLTWKLLKAAGRENCYRIGASYMTMNNPFYTVLDNRLLLKVDSMGDILMTRDPELDPKRQNEQILSLLEEGMDLLVVNPVDEQAILPALEQVHAAGIPIVAVDAPVADSSLVQCTIWSDNYDAGVQCALDLMTRTDSADILLLEHSAVRSSADRIRGFLDTIENHPGYCVVGRAECQGQLETAMPVVETFLLNGGSIDAVMALNDPSALGALEALEKHGSLEGTLVYGVDGTPEAKALVRDGIMTATAAQSLYTMGELLGETVYQILAGESVESEIVVPVQLITAENVHQFSVNDWQ